MTRGRPPECPICRVSANLIQHVLETCPAFDNSRRTYGLNRGYAALLGEDCPAEKLIDFLTEIGLAGRI